MTTKRELNYMNAIACLLVILIHVLSLGITSADRSSWQAAVIYFPWRLAAFVVPMFLYTGAVKMARQFEGRAVTVKTYVQYCLQRIRKIYVPYVIWVILYYVCFKQINYVRGEPQEFFSYLLIGNLSSPFYYVVIVMQFYFLMPVWIRMLKHIPAWLAVSISLLITFCMQQCSYILSLCGITFPYSDRVFLTYMIFWTVGLYVGKYYDAVARALPCKSATLCCAVILFCAALSYIQYTGSYLGFNMNDIKMVSDLLSIVFLHSVCLKLTRAPDTMQHFLQKLYESSFFVYLSHCLFLTLGTACLQGMGVHSLSLLLVARFCICYSVPFVLYLVYDGTRARLKLHTRLLG